MKITAIVPIQSNNKTIRENFILLHSKPLFLYIFETLLENVFIDEVICYSSNVDIKNFLPTGVKFIKRSKKLDKDDIRQPDILHSIAEKIISDYYILCSVTSPFISNASISKGIESILSHQYDSSLSVRKINAFTWFKDSPLNFSPNKPLNTNEIEPLYIETKGFYIFSRQNLLQNSCYGNKIFYVEVNPYEAINIKTEEDINFANNIINKPKISNKYFLLSKICKHIIFDMDGVLINSLKLMKKAWTYSGGEQYAPFSEYEKYIGIPFVKICEKVGIETIKIPSIKKKYFDFSRQNIQEIELFNGVKDTIHKLNQRNIQLSVVTSKDYQAAKEILEYFNLEIHSLIAPDSTSYTGRNKPFGDPLLYACILTHSTADESIFIGDMLSDYQSAKHANIDFVFADYGYGTINYPSIIAIKNIEEILLLTL